MKPIAKSIIAAAALVTASNALAAGIEISNITVGSFVGNNENFTWSASAGSGPMTMTLDVGAVRTFTYGSFSTSDFALGQSDLADNDDSFAVGWLLSGAQVNASGTPDALGVAGRSAHGLSVQSNGGKEKGGKDKHNGHGGKDNDKGHGGKDHDKDHGHHGDHGDHGGKDKNKGEARVDFDNSWIDVMFGNGGLYQVKFLDSDTLTHNGSVALKAKVRLVRDSSSTPPTPVPEPAGLALVAMALLGIALGRRRKG